MAKSNLDSRTKESKKRPLVAWVEYALYIALYTCLCALPLTWAYLVSEGCIRFLYWTFPKLKRRVREHIDLCFGESESQEERDQLYRDSLRYHAWFWVDMLLGPRIAQRDDFRILVDSRDAEKLIQSCRAHGPGGVLLVSSHQGGPDIITLAFGQAGLPVVAVARPIDNHLIAKSVQNARADIPRREIAKTGALFPAYRFLKAGDIVGIQVDQDAGPNGVFVPYFGQDASTHTGPAMLALQSGCPVVMIYAIRTKARRFAYRLIARTIDLPQPSNDDDATVLEWTRLMTADIEDMARRFPEQVLWAHRRWKTRPQTAPRNRLAKSANS